MKQHHLRIDSRMLKMLLCVSLFFIFQLSVLNSAKAQMPGGKAVEVSHKIQLMNGKR